MLAVGVIPKYTNTSEFQIKHNYYTSMVPPHHYQLQDKSSKRLTSKVSTSNYYPVIFVSSISDCYFALNILRPVSLERPALSLLRSYVSECKGHQQTIYGV